MLCYKIATYVFNTAVYDVFNSFRTVAFIRYYIIREFVMNLMAHPATHTTDNQLFLITGCVYYVAFTTADYL